ncbi:dethiobiotin synthase [Bacillus pseudomycoides]|uniref:ATP-dependent dethiobiotin synthetase BioD n=1 Tax=Bacillus pseudomycoides TaxID=64104 RepID=A0AA91VG09_9BACI|nr:MULTISPECIES: dethiobiotin synthase [Bacillus]PEB53217.1 dethiobiotin synthase [Bacillus sp. AFS098217]PED83913.1 dethiobiotin synthase [Bacillus pseudomycoides]PEU14616.1 dethiobiotin synthase [Bacillus sp. AFS019443]PEU19630.1 dethiobiotin synthase [Bacillus sp. AFS014408]PFW61755.1 dethiobiotin synthase [Bacillus sp. AFS075034]
MSGFFITATDTEVGKTVVTGALAGVLRNRGYNIGVYKPLQSGHIASNPEGDAARLKAASGVVTETNRICPYSIEEPLAPRLAMKRAGKTVTLAQITSHYNELIEEFDSLFVEGAGGLAVPFTEDALVVDFAKELKLPLIIVARPTLGTVNHTVLTISYAKAHGLTVIGVILSGCKECEMERVQENKEMIEELSGVPVLGLLPELREGFTREELLEAAKDHIMISKLEEFIQNGSNVARTSSI